ncbi:hypothetical protein BDK51DRAFT_23998, partial [Blyttiomyces helicus]
NVPHDAIVAGQEPDGRLLFVGRVNHDGGLHPGKVGAHLRGIFYPYGGDEKHCSHYEVLCGHAHHIQWVPIESNQQFQHARQHHQLLTGGHERDRRPLFIARTFHGRSIIPGKAGLHFGHKGCHYSWDEDERETWRFEVAAICRDIEVEQSW